MKTEVVKAHPLALAEAIRLAKGDRSRLEILPDGAVMVHNAGSNGRVRRRIVTRRPNVSLPSPPRRPPITQDY